MNERGRHDEPALFLLAVVLNVGSSVIEPVIGDFELVFDGFFAMDAIGEVDEELVVGVGRLGICVLEPQTFGLIVTCLLGNLRRVMLVLSDLVIQLLGLGVIALAKELVGAGQISGTFAIERRLLRLHSVSSQDQAIYWT